MAQGIEAAGSHEGEPVLISRDEWLAEYRAKVEAEEIRTGWVQPDKVWPGLVNRIDIPRITQHEFWPELLTRLDQGPTSYLEFGVGYGTDLRRVRDELDKRGFHDAVTLGVDMSQVEMVTGMNYFRRVHGEQTERAREWFAQGNLLELPQIHRWENAGFNKQGTLAPASFNLLYMEAVLHGLGRGVDKFDRLTEEQKYQRAATFMKHTYDLAAPGAVFFGRANVREHSEIPLSIIQKGAEAGLINWRYLPPQDDLRKLLTDASGMAGRGFQMVSEKLTPHAYGEGENQDQSKGERLGEYRLSFIAKKV